MKVYVPLDSAAVSLGANEVALTIAAYAKARGMDVEIVRNGSRGMVWLEPLVEVESDGARLAYGPLTPADVPALMEGALDTLGPVEDIPFFAAQTRVTFARCGVSGALDFDAYLAGGGGKGIDRALALGAAETVEEVRQSGLRGRGGAGFPTGIKWETVRTADAPQKYIVCNADEGDSGTFADRMLMEGDPFTLIEGMAIAGLAVGADKGFIYLRSEYPIAHEILTQAIEIAKDRGLIGAGLRGSNAQFDLEVRLGAGAYVCGEETSLLNSLEGKRGTVRAKPPLPALEGLFGAPTVVNNVISLATIPAIVADGAEAYAAHGIGRSRGTVTLQLAGNVKYGGLFEAGFGMTLGQAVEEIGGGTLSGRPVKAVQVGGPLGAYMRPDQFDTPLGYEEFDAAGGLIGHAGLTVFDDTADMGALAAFAMEFCAIESCGKCTPCRIGAVRGGETVARIRSGDAQAVPLLEDLCQTMRDGSLCALGGFTPYPVLSALHGWPEDFGITRSEAAE